MFRLVGKLESFRSRGIRTEVLTWIFFIMVNCVAYNKIRILRENIGVWYRVKWKCVSKFSCPKEKYSGNVILFFIFCDDCFIKLFNPVTCEYLDNERQFLFRKWILKRWIRWECRPYFFCDLVNRKSFCGVSEVFSVSVITPWESMLTLNIIAVEGLCDTFYMPKKVEKNKKFYKFYKLIIKNSENNDFLRLL